jgi:hypothetical protein
LTIEFGLPGDEKMFTKRARVVRRINEFVFAVHFLAPGEELRPAMDRFATYARWSTWFGLGQRISRWAQAHKQGALLCFVGLVVALIVGTWIYLGSDQYLGRQLRSWGREIPRQWYWDYYNKIPGAQTSPQDAPQTPPKTSP